MVIKIVYKTKISYTYVPNVSMTVDSAKRVISLGPHDFKITPAVTAYVMNEHGSTCAVIRAVK